MKIFFYKYDSDCDFELDLNLEGKKDMFCKIFNVLNLFLFKGSLLFVFFFWFILLFYLFLKIVFDNCMVLVIFIYFNKNLVRLFRFEFLKVVCIFEMCLI